MTNRISPQMMARVDCLICESLPTLGIRQLLRPRRRQSPHPDAEHRSDDEPYPAQPHGNHVTSDDDLCVPKQPHGMADCNYRENH